MDKKALIITVVSDSVLFHQVLQCNNIGHGLGAEPDVMMVACNSCPIFIEPPLLWRCIGLGALMMEMTRFLLQNRSRVD